MKPLTYFLRMLLVVLLCLVGPPLETVEAAVIWEGDVVPSNPRNWGSNDSVYIGWYNTGTLTVDWGSAVLSRYGYIGYGSSVTGTVTVADSGSTWTNSYRLSVGAEGRGTLNVAAGGKVSSPITVVGDHGIGTLNIRTGGEVSSSISLGSYAGSQGTVTITGTGSKLTTPDALEVGSRGIGTLNVLAGGQMSSHGADVGFYSGSQGIVTVNGNGSNWKNSDYLCVGYDGAGTLNIQAGGTVSNTWAYLGDSSGSQGSATVTGSGSKWANSERLVVGHWNGVGTLTVANGGLVTANTLWASSTDLYGNGTITAKGAILDNGSLVFDSTSGAQPTLPFGTGGALNLNLDGTGDLGAGYRGAGTLAITDGVRVVSRYGYLGYGPVSQGSATVSGGGSKWTNSSYLYVGYSGTGTLDVEAGGQVSSTMGYLGYGSGSQSTTTVTGSGSKWTNTSDLYVGYSGTGTLNVEAGGEVSVVATLSINTRGTVTLDGGTLDARTISASGTTNFLAGTLRFGTYQGSLTNTGATISSRDAVYGMDVTGNYLQGAAGRLLIEVGGLPESGLFDDLTVGGTANLAGTLAIDFTAFEPPDGSTTYQFLNAAAITGTFDAYEVIGLDPSQVSYDIPAGQFTVMLVAVPEPSTLALLLAAAFCLLAYVRRNR